MAPTHSTTAPPKPPILNGVRHLTIEYLGFKNGQNRREYMLCARLGTEAREYTVWIANAAFSSGHASLQDGPDICYQKLHRNLVDVGLIDAPYVEVTDSELLEYRTAHTPATRRSNPPPPPRRS
jgi:hypothetical protein